MEAIAKVLIMGVGGFAATFLIGLLGGLPVWLLWNWLMPLIFSLKTISFLEAVGLSILCSCLFKSTSSSSK